MYVWKPFSSLNAEMGNENKNSQDEEYWIDDQQDILPPLPEFLNWLSNLFSTNRIQISSIQTYAPSSLEFE